MNKVVWDLCKYRPTIYCSPANFFLNKGKIQRENGVKMYTFCADIFIR